MSRLPTSRFPPPVLFQQPAGSAPPLRPSASTPVLYDSDSYDEDGGSFQLLPSPEHYLHTNGDSPVPRPLIHKSATQPVIYDEEDELVSPSSSFTTMSPSANLDQLPPPVSSQRKPAAADADNEQSRVQSSRNNRVQHRNTWRLDLMDADEDESVNEEDDESDARQQQQQRQRDAVQPSAVQSVVQSKRSSAVLSSPPFTSAITTSSTTSILAAVTPGSFAATSPVPVPARPNAPSQHLAAPTSDVSLPSASYDEYNDSMLSGHSLNDSPAARFERTRRSTRTDEDDEDDGAYGQSADVIELEDDERERESSGSAGKLYLRNTRAQSATHAVAALPSERRSTPSPQLVPLLSSVPASLHASSSSFSISSLPTTSPTLTSSSSVPVVQHSRPVRSLVPLTARPASMGAVDDEGEDGDDEHDDQHNEETDETSSAIISLPASAQDKHETIRSFGGVASSPLRTLTSSYSIQPPSLSHTASTSSSSSSSSSSSPSYVSAITELPTSPTSGAEDAEAEDYNDDNVFVVTSPHHSHSPPRASQQAAPATDEDDESEPSFQLQLQEEIDSGLQSKPTMPIVLPAALSSPPTSSRRPSHVSPAAGPMDEFADVKSRREKLIAGKAARLAKKSKHDRWEKDSSARRDSKRHSAATKVSRRSNDHNDSDDSLSSSGSSSNSSTSDRSGDERREAENAADRGRDAGSNNSNGSRRRSPLPHSSLTPPSPARPPIAQPSSRSSSPTQATYRPQHDDPHHLSRHSQQQNLESHDDTGSAWRRSSSKQRAERWPSDDGGRDSTLLPVSQPLPLTRTGSQSARARSKKKRGSSEDEIQVADLDFKEKIGEGAYGDVYRGYLWGQEVAIKQIRLDSGKEEAEEETVREFRREMRIMKHLRHPNVVEFLGACMSEQSLCLLTEYMPNGSMEDHLSRLRREGKRMRESRVVSLSLDVVKGLNWLHHKGIIHRDLKSANILLDAAGRSKLSDFGLSHVRRRDESMNGYHGVAGTPSYIAPEVLQGREYGVKADVYSLGVLINEMLATTAPFDDTPLAQLDLPSFEAAVLAGGRPKLAECHDAALAQLVRDCWHADPESRPTVESIMKTLERIDKDTQTQQQQQLAQHATESATSPSQSSALDDLPTPLRSLLANDYARLYQMQAALAEQEKQLRAQSAAMASEKAAREEEHKQWTEVRERHKRDETENRKIT